MTPAQALIKLAQLGVPPDRLEEALSILEAVQSPWKSKEEERKSKDRLRKSKEFQSVPTPLRDNTNLDNQTTVIQEPTPTPSVPRNSRAHGTNPRAIGTNPRAVAEDHPRFAEFWLAYPERDGGNPRKPASKAFSAACKRADPQAIIDGVRRYAEAMAARGRLNTEYVQMARTWLNQDRWNETYGTPAVSSKPTIQDGFAKVRAVINEIARREADASGTLGAEDALSLPRLRESGR